MQPVLLITSAESLSIRDYLVKIIRGGKMDHPSLDYPLINEYSLSKAPGQEGTASGDSGGGMLYLRKSLNI